MGALLAADNLTRKRTGSWQPSPYQLTEDEKKEKRNLQNTYDEWDQGGGSGLTRSEEKRLRELETKARTPDVDSWEKQQETRPDYKPTASPSRIGPPNAPTNTGRVPTSQPRVVTRTIAAPAPAPIYREVPSPTKPAPPSKPAFRKTASGGWVEDTEGKKKKKRLTGRGRRSTILTTEGELGSGAEIKKQTLGG